METLYWKQYKDSLLLAECIEFVWQRLYCFWTPPCRLCVCVCVLDTTLQVVLCVCVCVLDTTLQVVLCLCVLDITLQVVLCVCVCRVQLFANPWTVPLSMGFSRQKYSSGLPFPPPRDLPDTGMEPWSPALQADSLLSEPPGKPTLNVDDAQLWASPFSFSIFLSKNLRMGRLPLLGKCRRLMGGGARWLVCIFWLCHWLAAWLRTDPSAPLSLGGTYL